MGGTESGGTGVYSQHLGGRRSFLATQQVGCWPGLLETLSQMLNEQQRNTSMVTVVQSMSYAFSHIKN